MVDFLRAEGGNDAIDGEPGDRRVRGQHRYRNAAMAHLMASFGNLNNPVDEVLHAYFRQCAIEMSCVDLARAGGFLAHGGVRPDGDAGC